MKSILLSYFSFFSILNPLLQSTIEYLDHLYDQNFSQIVHVFLQISMDSSSNTKTWVPYMNPKDCSQGFCSIYCPEWCYIVFPPPPPQIQFSIHNSTPSFTPLVIAIIGVLASAFLIVSYYAVISKYCKNRDLASSSRTRVQNGVVDMELDGNNHDPSHNFHYTVSTNGLNEELIKEISVLKFKKGVIQETECSICLSEFHDDESLRLLPKCSHAFHAICVDVWLKSHSNCPLCRANIGLLNYEVIEIHPQEQDNVVESAETEHETEQIDVHDSDTIFFVEGDEVRRPVSMETPVQFQRRLTIGDVLEASVF